MIYDSVYKIYEKQTTEVPLLVLQHRIDLNSNITEESFWIGLKCA